MGQPIANHNFYISEITGKSMAAAPQTRSSNQITLPIPLSALKFLNYMRQISLYHQSPENRRHSESKLDFVIYSRLFLYSIT